MDYFDIIVKKAEAGINWLDSVPSVPAAGVAFVVGLLIPVKPWIILGGAVIVYAAIKIHSKLDDRKDS